MMKKYLALTAALLLALSGAFSASAAAQYQEIVEIYKADRFLQDDTKPASEENQNRYMGVNQRPASGGSYLENDQTIGKAALVQKTEATGKNVSFWMSRDMFQPIHDGVPADISACANPGMHLWLFVSKITNVSKLMGVDKTSVISSSKNSNYGVIAVSIGNTTQINKGQNYETMRHYYINADDLKNGWNEIVFPIKPKLSGDSFTFDGRKIKADFSEKFDYSEITWFSVDTLSKGALMMKISDIYFCDLSKPLGSNSQGTQSTGSPQSGGTQSANKPQSTATQSAGNSQNPGTQSADNASVEASQASEAEVSSRTAAASSRSEAAQGDAEPDDKDGADWPLIIGIIAAALLVLGGAGATAFYLVKRRQKNGEKAE